MHKDLMALEQRCADIICVMDNPLVEIVFREDLQTNFLQHTLIKMNECSIAAFRIQRYY